MRKHILLFAIFKLCHTYLFAQNTDEKYLSQLALQSQSEDINVQYQTTMTLSRYWNFRNDTLGLKYAEKALTLAEKAQNKHWQGAAKILMGIQFVGLHDYQKADEYFWKVCVAFPNPGDTLHAEARYYLAENCDFKEDVENKIPYAAYAYTCAKKCNHYGLIAQAAAQLSFFNMFNNADRPKAIEMQLEAEKYIELGKNTYPLNYFTRALASLEIVGIEKPDFPKAKEYCKLLSLLCEKERNVRYGTFANTGLAYMYNQDK